MQRNKTLTEVDRQTRHKGTRVSGTTHALILNAETRLK